MRMAWQLFFPTTGRRLFSADGETNPNPARNILPRSVMKLLVGELEMHPVMAASADHHLTTLSGNTMLNLARCQMMFCETFSAKADGAFRKTCGLFRRMLCGIGIRDQLSSNLVVAQYLFFDLLLGASLPRFECFQRDHPNVRIDFTIQAATIFLSNRHACVRMVG